MTGRRNGTHASARRIGRGIGAVIIAAAAVTTINATPANAYDQNTCQAGLRSDVDQFRVDTGGSGDVDFGDDLHVGGVPQGTAVVCWASGGSAVSLTGKLYWDSFDPGCADSDVTIFRRDGSVGSFQQFPEICSNGGLASRVIESSLFSNASNLDRVSIRLFRRDLQQARTRVGTFNIRFGD